jgi:hypothetical protein
MTARAALFAFFLAAPLAVGCASKIEFVVPDDGGSDALPDGGSDVETCAQDQCGPIPPTVPPTQCWDGSWSGMTGACIKRSDGTCGWETHECPPAKQCGAIPGGDCPSGTYCKLATGSCSLPGALGTCALKTTACSDIWAPVCGCNGTTYGNDCDAAGAGENLAHTGECGATPGACTTATVLKDCGTESICKVPIGNCSKTAAGTCAAQPKTCPATYVPVCGCDGKTYGNACLADQVGMAIASNGACVNVKACGGFAGSTCAASEFCAYQVGQMCGAADASSTCQPRPTVCDKTYDPVCACDGKTYSNPCLANMAGFGVNTKGACK